MVVFETDAWHFRYFPLPKTETLCAIQLKVCNLQAGKFRIQQNNAQGVSCNVLNDIVMTPYINKVYSLENGLNVSKYYFKIYPVECMLCQ